MPATGTIQAIQQFVMAKLKGDAAIGALVGTDPNLLDVATNQPIKAIYNDYRKNTPPIYPQICFRVASANQMRFSSLRVKRYFLEVEVWTNSRSSDAGDKLYELLDGYFNNLWIDINAYDSKSYCYDAEGVTEVPTQWDEKTHEGFGAYRYLLTAGRDR